MELQKASVEDVVALAKALGIPNDAGGVDAVRSNNVRGAVLALLARSDFADRQSIIDVLERTFELSGEAALVLGSYIHTNLRYPCTFLSTVCSVSRH